jgi:hypothetical protein
MKAPIIRQRQIAELEEQKQKYLGQIGIIDNKQKELREATDCEILLKEKQRETSKTAKEPVEQECRQS